MKIDKSVFTARELAQYEALIAKAKVEETEAGEEEDAAPVFPPRKTAANPLDKAEDDMPDDEEAFVGEDEEETEKSSGKGCRKADPVVSPEMNAAMKRLAKLEKSIAMKEFTEIAKRYAPLGEDESELAKTLYSMKNTNENNYNAYIDVLEKSLDLVEKSGIFTEIGKTGSAGFSGGIVAQVEAEASDIMKSDTSMTYEQAMAKAWENNPELLREYEAGYFGR